MGRFRFITWTFFIITITVIVMWFIQPPSEQDSKFTILRVPNDGVIWRPGKYYLADDFVSDRNTVIRIRANQVEVDLNERTIKCNPVDHTSATTVGISIDSAHHVRIFGGNITGCYQGLLVTDGEEIHISDIDFSLNTYTGVQAQGENITVINSTFSRLGGYTHDAYASGIRIEGRGCLVKRNIFTDIYRQNIDMNIVGEGVGIIFGDKSIDCRAEWNIIKNSRIDGHTIGIWAGRSRNLKLNNNVIINFERVINGAQNTVAQHNIVLAESPLPKLTGIYLSHEDASIVGNTFVNITRPFGYENSSKRSKSLEKMNAIFQ